MSAVRLVTETALILGGYVQFSKFGTFSGHNELLPLRKGLVLDNDQEYINLLRK